MIIRGTTPTLTLSFDDSGIDLTTLKSIYITISQVGKILTKTNKDEGMEISPTEISIFLSQEETLFFHQGEAEVQFRALTEGGEAIATEAYTIKFQKVLLDKVIT